MSGAGEPRFPYLELDVPGELAAELGPWLCELGALGVEQRDDTTLARGPGGGLCTLRASFATRREAERAAAVVAADPDGIRWRIDEVVGDAWRDKYKEHFAPFALTRSVTVAPPWVSERPAGELVLWLDPGRAFGTGLHATTALVAEVLEEHRAELTGRRVLDVGTGSGILALTALALGAAEAVAIDNDPDVIEVARDNARRNGLVDRLAVSTTPLEQVAGAFPVVVANIEADTLVRLRDALLARTAAGGLLVLSGILAERHDEVLAEYRDGCTGHVTTRSGGRDDAWVALALRRGRSAMVRLPLGSLASGERALDRAAARYLCDVHRLAVGDAFVAFDPEEQREADAVLVAAGRTARVLLSEVRPATALPLRRVAVIQAAAKGSRVEDVVRDATELGASVIVVALTSRSVRRPSSQASRRRWERVAVEAARQCGRGDVPQIVGPVPVEEAFAQAEGAKLLLHPGAPEALGQRLVSLEPGEAITLAVGPEGGFTPDELACAAQRGFAAVSLGRFVLRTETACAAALGAVASLGRGSG